MAEGGKAKCVAAACCLLQDMCKTERRKAGLKELCSQLGREVRMALAPVAKYVDQVGGRGCRGLQGRLLGCRTACFGCCVLPAASGPGRWDSSADTPTWYQSTALTVFYTTCSWLLTAIPPLLPPPSPAVLAALLQAAAQGCVDLWGG